MKNAMPVVSGPPTKHAGTYKLGVPPTMLAQHNLVSWRVIKAILDAYDTADFLDLAVAVRGHMVPNQTAGNPQVFVAYCIRRGWLQRA